MRLVLFTFILIFYALMLLPGAQYVFDLIPRKSIAGLPWVDRSVPKASVDAILSGAFQHKFETWFTQNMGFWGISVRLDSEVNSRLFKQSTANYAPLVVHGKNKTLYRDQYVEDYNRGNLVAPEELERRAINFKLLQSKLAERGVPVLYLITPTKAALYPENLPESRIVRRRLSKKRNYDYFVQYLDQHGVEYIDAHRFFADRREEYPYGVFATTGSHWNDIAICDVSRLVLDKLREKLGKKLVDFTCRPIKVKPFQVGADQDLLDLLNLWDETPYYVPTPYPQTETIRDGDEYQPDLLFVGDSFLDGLLRFYDWHKVYAERDMFFYYKRNRHYPSNSIRPIYRSALKWEEDIFAKDAIIVEINEAFVQYAGFNFVPDALKALGIAADSIAEKEPG
ncbi:MAG: hypothetical protein KDD69_08630 [Bdellovibrionales bacterium]|nr:hypothetical protein [Bdellovibrionales bacterium]